FDVGAVSNPHNVQFAHESRRDALHRIRRERPRQPVQRGVLVGSAFNLELAVALLHRDALRDRHRQLPLGPGHFQLLADLNLHAARQRDRLFTNSRHKKPRYLLSKRRLPWPLPSRVIESINASDLRPVRFWITANSRNSFRNSTQSLPTTPGKESRRP